MVAAKKRAKKKKTTATSLRKEADRLYQQILIRLKPKSIVSNEPTEVIHHYIPKSQSNNLRYDFDNGVPLTNKEHDRHHLSGDPSIVATIIERMGFKWNEKLQARRRIPCRLDRAYLEVVMKKLNVS
jgi:hypothetical protein